MATVELKSRYYVTLNEEEWTALKALVRFVEEADCFDPNSESGTDEFLLWQEASAVCDGVGILLMESGEVV